MSKYKKILLALDLKPEDDEAVAEQAVSLAEAENAEINIVHVIEPIYTYGIAPGTNAKFQEWHEEFKASAKKEMEKIGQKFSIPQDRQYISLGMIKTEILRTAEKIGADLIVVGTHARHGLSALFVGNTADDMVHSAKCDILAVNIPSKK